MCDGWYFLSIGCDGWIRESEMRENGGTCHSFVFNDT